MSRAILATSANFRVEHEWEDVFLVVTSSEKVTQIGDFYGDPECAVIDSTEQWVAVGGHGLMVCNLDYNSKSKYIVTRTRIFGQEQDDSWWIESMEQTGVRTLRIVVRGSNRRDGHYEFDLEEMRPTEIKPMQGEQAVPPKCDRAGG